MSEGGFKFAPNHRRAFRVGVPLLPPFTELAVNVHVLTFACIAAKVELLNFSFITQPRDAAEPNERAPAGGAFSGCIFDLHLNTTQREYADLTLKGTSSSFWGSNHNLH